jgi:hypothetical protein
MHEALSKARSIHKSRFLLPSVYSFRDFLNWQLVRDKAAEMVEEMVHKTPELKDKLHFPRGQHNLHHVVPIRSRYLHLARSSFFEYSSVHDNFRSPILTVT